MKYYQENLDVIFKKFNSSKDGLSSVDAKKRLEKEGLNVLDTEVKINPWKIFLEQFKSFIIYILIFAVIISLVVGFFHDSEQYVDAVIIFIILIINAVVGFFQEYSAQRSLEALKKMNIVKAKVYRDKNIVEMDSKYLVCGDVIYLEAGDKIPADCRLIEEKLVKVEEAVLTGESVPVDKDVKAISKDVQIGDMRNMLFSSTALAEGVAKAIVVKTGMNTEIGKITKLIKTAEEGQTPLQKKLDGFGKVLGNVVIGVCVLIFLVLGVKDGFSLENSILFAMVAISLAVAAVPEGLPTVVTVALSVGVKRLLAKKALVRKLTSVEALGSCDVICTDKTGTLTKNEMTVVNAWNHGCETSISGAGYNPVGAVSNSKISDLLFKTGLLCNNASLYKEDNLWQISGDPTEGALIVSAKKVGITDSSKRVDEIPFDSTRKLMSVLIREDKKLCMYTKGSPDKLLKKCSYILVNGKVVHLTQKLKDEVLVQNDIYSAKALRVLGFAYKKVEFVKEFKEEHLIFVGLQAMIDPPREDVIQSINKTRKAGIRVIMITGDYKETARAIGKSIGIEGNVLTGDDLDSMSDFDLGQALKNNVNIFARVIPEHKQKIIDVLQKDGHVVAMTGDGVNDAPALKKANIGVAVGSGTDVAKEASDFVLLDDSFTNIVNAIEEGRGIYENIQKSIMLLLSGNFGEVLIIFLAIILGFNLPLTAILLLWINLITDGAPALALSVDPYGRNIMRKKPIASAEGILPFAKLVLIGVSGIVAAIIALVVFSMYGGNDGESASVIAQTMIFNFIVLYEILLVFIIRAQYDIKQFSNVWLWGSVALAVGLQLLIMYTSLSEKFGVVPLNWSDWGVLFVSGIVFVLCYGVYRLVLKFKEKKLFVSE